MELLWAQTDPEQKQHRRITGRDPTQLRCFPGLPCALAPYATHGRAAWCERSSLDAL